MSRKVRHRKLRIMASIAAMFPEHNKWLQDVASANMQGQGLPRDVYVKSS